MKNTKKITLCGIFVALSVAIMLVSYFPYLTYSVPAVAGLCIMAIVIEYNWKWAFLGYLASAFLVFLFAETEAKLLYVFILGYYPIIKSLVEKLNKPIIEWLIKLIIFNIGLVLIYGLFSNIFGIQKEDFDFFGKFGIYLALVIVNIVFVIYDIAVSRMALFYIYVVRPKIKKFL